MFGECVEWIPGWLDPLLNPTTLLEELCHPKSASTVPELRLNILLASAHLGAYRVSSPEWSTDDLRKALREAMESSEGPRYQTLQELLTILK